jgi:hypothetical protein
LTERLSHHFSKEERHSEEKEQQHLWSIYNTVYSNLRTTLKVLRQDKAPQSPPKAEVPQSAPEAEKLHVFSDYFWTPPSEIVETSSLSVGGSSRGTKANLVPEADHLKQKPDKTKLGPAGQQESKTSQAKLLQASSKHMTKVQLEAPIQNVFKVETGTKFKVKTHTSPAAKQPQLIMINKASFIKKVNITKPPTLEVKVLNLQEPSLILDGAKKPPIYSRASLIQVQRLLSHGFSPWTEDRSDFMKDPNTHDVVLSPRKKPPVKLDRKMVAIDAHLFYSLFRSGPAGYPNKGTPSLKPALLRKKEPPDKWDTILSSFFALWMWEFSESDRGWIYSGSRITDQWVIPQWIRWIPPIGVLFSGVISASHYLHSPFFSPLLAGVSLHE